MINLFLGAVQAALLATGGAAANHAARPPIVEVRMVCDQNCNCWSTRYQEHRPALADRPDLACPPPATGRPALGYYNGHYRMGPAAGLGFDSRSPVREFAFPF
ncbi:hypothetical protein [Bradyrhizobium ganzhouense]|uniref:hypothetical protein n=1 Tax=Bradyrhizobium ganzhouense TaxID=1179767 RepID=UPI003CEB20EA